MPQSVGVGGEFHRLAVEVTEGVDSVEYFVLVGIQIIAEPPDRKAVIAGLPIGNHEPELPERNALTAGSFRKDVGQGLPDLRPVL